MYTPCLLLCRSSVAIQHGNMQTRKLRNTPFVWSYNKHSMRSYSREQTQGPTLYRKRLLGPSWPLASMLSAPRPAFALLCDIPAPVVQSALSILLHVLFGQCGIQHFIFVMVNTCLLFLLLSPQPDCCTRYIQQTTAALVVFAYPLPCSSPNNQYRTSFHPLAPSTAVV